MNELLTFEGTITDIIFRNENNGFTVGVLSIGKNQNLTFTGVFVSVPLGSEVTMEGVMVTHPVYGTQLKAQSIKVPDIQGKSSIMAYLCSGVLRGVGRVMAERIYDKFGDDTIDVLDNSPERLLEVDGIGKQKLSLIIESYDSDRGMNRIIMKLAEYDFSPSLTMRIYKAYGENADKIIKENPYALCHDIKGIGFKKADLIALKIGFDKSDVRRLNEGILYVLHDAAKNGNMFLPEEELIKKASHILGVEREKVEDALFECSAMKDTVVVHSDDFDRVYLYYYKETENYVAQRLMSFLQDEEDLSLSVDEQIKAVEDKEMIQLAPMQKLAVEKALSYNMMILTGGPGTGKTTVVKFILSCLDDMGLKVALCAPTGRAAKRLSETSRREALTIHRLLEVGFSDDDEINFFNRDENNPLEFNAVIVDETSMVDIFLMSSLLKAMAPNSKLILIGDSDQLPSVGPGNLLKDMIESKLIPTVTLKEIFRQKEKSNIIINAHRVNEGKNFIQTGETSDFFFMQRNTEEAAQNLIISLVSERLAQYFNMPSDKIQVLSPVRKSGTGTHELNRLLQEKLNPKSVNKFEFEHRGRILREGDKVMQIRNDYKKTYIDINTNEEGDGIFNGDMGFIDTVDNRMKQFYVTFDDDRRAKYEFNEAEDIEHSYVVTVHKSQGSEFDVVLLVLLSVPPMLLSRNILYTAITRAKHGLVIVGDLKYVDMMIQNRYTPVRYSALAEVMKTVYENSFTE